MKGPDIFSASEIATALAWPKHRVLSSLGGTPRRGSKTSRGNVADAWALADLPPLLSSEVHRLKEVYRYRSAEDVLRNPLKRWQPHLPLSKVRADDVEEARKLQQALARALALPLETTIAERVRIAEPDCARAFGRTLSARQIRRLIERTLERDRMERAFDRLELYLSDSARAVELPKQKAIARGIFGPIDDAIAALENPATPNAVERAYCWKIAMEWLAERLADGGDEAKEKATLGDYLWRTAPQIFAKSQGALARNIRRKWEIASAEGIDKLRDGRRERVRTVPPDWEENLQLLARWSIIRHGRPVQAWRELYLGTTPAIGEFHEGQQFTEAFREYYKYDVRRAKSRIPTRVLNAVRPIIEATRDLTLGPRQARLRMPSLHRDWSDTGAYDYCSADDITPDVVTFEEHEFGEYEAPGGWRFNVGRGQLLLIVDERTDFPLGFSLLSTPTYNGNDIRTLFCRTWMDERIGIPNKGANLEKGVWRSLAVKSLFSWPEIEEAFAGAGIRLRARHATTPKAKTIERVIGSAHHAMDHVRGWVGNDEVHQKFERVQRFLQALKRFDQPRKEAVDPREMLISKAAFADEIKKALTRFANEPQNGMRMPGKSPAEMWQELRGNRPAIVLPESLRYLLATNRSAQRVTHEGIKLRVGSELNYYVGSAQLGAMQGKIAEVYFNPELPEQIVVIDREADPLGQAPFSVPLRHRVPANSATKADFAAVRAQGKAFASFGKAQFRTFTPPCNVTLRNERLGSDELRETGSRIAAVEKKAIESGRQRGKEQVEVRRELHEVLARLQAEEGRNAEQLAP